MINYLKFRFAIWILRGVKTEHIELKNIWDWNIDELEELYPHRNCAEFCNFCNGACTHDSQLKPKP